MDAVKGIVCGVHAGGIDVRVIQQSACSGCHARAACTSHESCERMVSVRDYPDGVKVGDTVLLVAKESMTLRAVLLAFVAPLALMLIVAVVLTGCAVQDLAIALVLLALLLMYWGGVYLCRGYIDRKLVFWAEPVEQRL